MLPRRVQHRVLGLPWGAAESTQDECHRNGWAFAQVDPVRPASAVASQTVGQRSGCMERIADAGVELPRTFVAVIPRGQVLGRTGSCITPDGRLLLDVSANIGGRAAWRHRAFTGYLWAPPARRVRGRVAVLGTAGAGNYYHWMIEALPRVDLLRRSGIELDAVDAFVVPDVPMRAIEESLGALGIPASRLLRARHLTNLRADELLVPSLPARSGMPAGESIEFIRTLFGGAAGRGHGRRIFADRRTGRVVRNGEEIRAVLRGLGFEPVLMDGLALAEQAGIFAGAEAVVGVHGAALANLAFCAPGTRVLELLAPTYVNSCFAALSAAAGLRHHYLLGSGQAAERNGDRMADLVVDAPELERAIRAMLAT